MKKLITLAIILVACGDGGSIESGTGYYTKKFTDWHEREAVCPNIETWCPDTGEFYWDLYNVLKQLPIIAYRKDGQDRWNATPETLADLSGDCDDMATLAYRTISNSCLMNKYGISVGIRVYDNGERDHVIAVVYHEGAVYEVDNLCIRNSPTEKSIICEF